MSAGIDTIRTDDSTEDPADDPSDPCCKTLDVSDVPPDRVTAYARETVAAGHPELYFERKGGRTYLVAR